MSTYPFNARPAAPILSLKLQCQSYTINVTLPASTADMMNQRRTYRTNDINFVPMSFPPYPRPAYHTHLTPTTYESHTCCAIATSPPYETRPAYGIDSHLRCLHSKTIIAQRINTALHTSISRKKLTRNTEDIVRAPHYLKSRYQMSKLLYQLHAT